MSESWPGAIKRTKQREEVYQVLLQADGPLTAIEIYRKLPEYALSTIYRALLAFAEHDIVIKFNLPGEDTAVYELNHGEHKHYAVCLNCHEWIPLKQCPLEHMNIQTQDGFIITDHKIEIYGYCKKCSKGKEETLLV